VTHARVCRGAAVLLASLISGSAELHAQTQGTQPVAARDVSKDDSSRVAEIVARYATPRSAVGAKGPGCVASVSLDGILRLTTAKGFASIEHEIPNSATTAFNIGSISKQFTAMAVLLLEARGALSLDDPVSRFVTGLPAVAATLRVRDLLYHTSGLRDLGALGMLAGSFVRSMPEFRAQMQRQQGLNFPVGRKHEYSHSDYNLLADVIERASGMPYGEFLAQQIFRPLGMTGTYVYDERRVSIPSIATAYEPDSADYRMRFPASTIIGGTNIFTTVTDLARWQHNAYTARVGGEALVNKLYSAAPLQAPVVHPYSHGVWRATYRGQPHFHRSGGGGGFSTTLQHFPSAKLDVVALCNFAGANPFMLGREIADVFLSALPEEEDPARDSVPTPRAEATQLAGRYASEQLPWDPFVFAAHDGVLYEKYGTDSSRLIRLRNGSYVADGFTYTFSRTADSRLRLHFVGAEANEIATRIPVQPAWRPTAAELRAFSGRWLSDELGVSWRTEVRGDTLVLRRPGAPDVAMEPLDRDQFRASVLNGAGYATWIGLTYARDATQRVNAFTVGTVPAAFEVALGVRFERVP
jgi:CubicO group peptidase (beta-lactamase class C family)